RAARLRSTGTPRRAARRTLCALPRHHLPLSVRARPSGQRQYPPLPVGRASVVRRPLVSLKMHAVPVEFGAPGGPVLRGARWGSGERCAVLVHEEAADLEAWRPLVGDLLDLGLSVLAFDLRGHGASDDPWSPDGVVGDLRAALDAADARRLYLL